MDRELYPPESRTTNRECCRGAGIRDEVEFATSPGGVLATVERALAAPVPFAWFTAEEPYGQVMHPRFWLEQHDVGHVPAARRSDTVNTTALAQGRADICGRVAGAGMAADLYRADAGVS